MNEVVGVDIGGTTTEAIAVDATGAITARTSVLTGNESGAAVVKSTLDAVAGVSPAPAVVGIGVPGQVDTADGTVRLAVNLNLGAPRFPLGTEVAGALGIPVVVENDVRAAALGVYEALDAAGEGVGSLALLSIGTGISAGIVIDGRIHRGAQGMAGEIGHVVVDANGPACRCGVRGCLEAVASGPALVRAWPDADPGRVTGSLLDAARVGNTDARRVMTDLTARLASALHWLAAAYDVELIVLGGGVASTGPQFLDVVRAALVELARGSELASRTISPDRVVLAPPGEPIGARGAAALALRHLETLAAPTSSP